MSLYPTVCKKCGNLREIVCSINDRDEIYKGGCECGGDLITDWADMTIGFVDTTIGYYDNQLGCYIGSTSDRRRIMKERNLEAFTGTRSVKEQMASEVERNKKERKESERSKIRELVKQKVHDLAR